MALLSFGAALLAAVVAALYALRSLTISQEYKAVSGNALFGSALLEHVRNTEKERAEELSKREKERAAEELSKQKQSAESFVDKECGESPTDASLREYLLSMSIHLWSIVRKHRENHERKALLVQRGQRAFAGFLLSLALVFACVVVVAAWKAYG